MPLTIDEALAAGGLDGQALLGLARKAANDALRKRGAFLDDDRLDELVGFMLEVGLCYATKFDGYLTHNPAKLAGPNPMPTPREIRTYSAPTSSKRSWPRSTRSRAPPSSSPLPPGCVPRTREWAPAIDAAGIAKPARLYDLRSTFASNGLPAGITLFELARVMGTSSVVLESHYGTLIDTAHDAILNRLEGLAHERGTASHPIAPIPHKT